MIEFGFKTSFDRAVKKLPGNQKKDTVDLCCEIIDVLDGKKELRKGIRLKNLRKNIWEISEGMQKRVIFSWIENRISFILAGSHDRIKGYLKENL